MRTEKRRNLPLKILLTLIILFSERAAAGSGKAYAGDVEAAAQGKAQNPEPGPVPGRLGKETALPIAKGMAAKQLPGQWSWGFYLKQQLVGLGYKPADKLFRG